MLQKHLRIEDEMEMQGVFRSKFWQLCPPRFCLAKQFFCFSLYSEKVVGWEIEQFGKGDWLTVLSSKNKDEESTKTE